MVLSFGLYAPDRVPHCSYGGSLDSTMKAFGQGLHILDIDLGGECVRHIPGRSVAQALLRKVQASVTQALLQEVLALGFPRISMQRPKPQLLQTLQQPDRSPRTAGEGLHGRGKDSAEQNMTFAAAP
jgi:hypothetical protein